MNYRVLAKISCKMFSIYTFIKSIMFFQSFFFVFYQYTKKQGEQNIITVALPFILLLFTSVILWVFADKIASFMVKESENSCEIVGLNYEKLQIIAFSSIGIVILTSSIPDMITTALTMKLLGARSSMDSQGLTYKMIGYVIKTVLGLWLLLGTSGILDLLKTLRNAGVKGPDEE